jgi:hypothetical protein
MNDSQHKKYGMWLIVIAFFLLIFLSNLLSLTHDTAEAVGSLFGILLISYAAMKVYTRNKDEYAKSKGIYVVGLLSLLWVASVVVKEYIEKKDLQQSIRNVENLVEGNYSKITPPNQTANLTVPGYIDSKSNQATNALNQLVAVGIPYGKRTEENIKEIEQIGDSGLLDTKIFTNTSYLQQSQKSLIKLSQLLSEQKVIFEEMALAQRKAIDIMQIDDKLRSNILTGFNRGISENRVLLDLQLTASRQGINSIQTILNLALTNFGKTKVVQNTVDFGNQADNKTYLNAFNELQKAIADETKYAEQRENLKKKNLLKLQELIN